MSSESLNDPNVPNPRHPSNSKSLEMFKKFGPIVDREIDVDNQFYLQKRNLESQNEVLRGLVIGLGSFRVDPLSSHFEERCAEAMSKLEEIKESLATFEDMLSNLGFTNLCVETLRFIYEQLRQILKSILLMHYFKTGGLESPENICRILGIPLTDKLSGDKSPNCKIYIDIYSYELGLLDIGNGLYDYAEVGVGLGYYHRAKAVHEFLTKLAHEFSLIEKSEEIEEKLEHYQNIIGKVRKILFDIWIFDAENDESTDESGI